MTKPAFSCDLGYGVEHFSDLQQIAERQLNGISPRMGSTAWHRRIARRGGDLLGAPITRYGVLVARVSYNGRLWAAAPPGVHVPQEAPPRDASQQPGGAGPAVPAGVRADRRLPSPLEPADGGVDPPLGVDLLAWAARGRGRVAGHER